MNINTTMAIGAIVVLAILVLVFYNLWTPRETCPSTLIRNDDGSLTLQPHGKIFSDMNDFQQWWHSSGMNDHCPIPVLTGAVSHKSGIAAGEQMFATTPINKVDDYEFSRIFGYERDGHMDIPRQNFNKILTERFFDWADRPLTSDERRAKYAGLKEGFTAAGELRSDAIARYNEKTRTTENETTEFRLNREDKEVAKMVARAYEDDPNWEPVVTRVGANHWEVNELKPRQRYGGVDDAVDEHVVNTNSDKVDIQFQFREKEVSDLAIDPYFKEMGELPWTSEKMPVAAAADPFDGPMPGMERMFGPTFDHKKWY
jgi:hypothetical protein